MSTTIIPDGSNKPSTTGPAPRGWSVETIIDGRMAWMIRPVPLQPYTFTFDLALAHVFEREGEARDSRAAVWCWHDRHGQHPTLTVIYITDEYRARIAAEMCAVDLPGSHCCSTLRRLPVLRENHETAP